jgi:hypothetical protein
MNITNKKLEVRLIGIEGHKVRELLLQEGDRLDESKNSQEV